MAMAIDKRAVMTSSLLLLCGFMACKKRDEPAPAASVATTVEPAAASAAVAAAAAAASAAQAAAATGTAGASAAAVASVAAAAPALGEVKRFHDKEKVVSGTTKISLEASKVYDEPDASKPPVATLPKDLVVTRVATLGTDWELVEFPSGVGKVAPGWVETKSLVAPGNTASAKPATSASAAASTKPATSAVASAAPAPSATAAKVLVKPSMMRPPTR